MNKFDQESQEMIHIFCFGESDKQINMKKLEQEKDSLILKAPNSKIINFNKSQFSSIISILPSILIHLPQQFL